MPGGPKSEATRDLAISCLLVFPTIRQAAQRARVSERQLRQWLKEDQAFREAYAQARRQALQHALGQVQAAASAAVARLRRLLASDDEGVVLQAAKAILGTAIGSNETLDIMERLTALEEAAKRRAMR
jgi:hypothetical protein